MAKILWSVTGNEGFVADPISAVLIDPSGTYGVRAVADPDCPVVPPDTPLVQDPPGVFTYEFEGEPGLEYEYYIRVTEENNTYYISGLVIEQPLFDPTTLYGVRRLLVDISGRVDLVRDASMGDYSDMGLANIHINQAQRWLDRRLGRRDSETVLTLTLPPGQSVLSFTHARYVTGVYEVTKPQCRKRLWWSPAPINEAPDSMEQKDYLLHAVQVKPVDVERTIQVTAAWYSPTLVHDLDRSWWTVQHPLLLAQTAMMQLEISMRNKQGVADMMAPIIDDVEKIYHDLVEEEQSGPPWLHVMR